MGPLAPAQGALANQGELGRKARTLEEIERFEQPVLLVKGTESSRWLRDIVGALRRHYPRATVFDPEGSHACHIERIDEFMPGWLSTCRASDAWLGPEYGQAPKGAR